MKKVLITICLAIGATVATNAQEIDFGVQVGVNFAKLQGDLVEDADGRTGINVGLNG